MPLTVYRRGRIWHYRGTVAGRKLRGSTGATDKRIAERIAAETEARQWKGHLDGPASVLTFANAVTLYLDAQKPARFVLRLLDYWKDTPVKAMTAGAIQQSAIDLYPTSKGATRNRAVIVPTQAIVNNAASRGLAQAARVPRFHEERTEREPATWAWIEAFRTEASPHLGALAAFMFLTGARIGEAIALTWEEVDLTRKRALIRQTKTGRDRVAHLQDVLLVALANIPDRATRVFKYTDEPGRSWSRAIARAGIVRLSFHSCRHGFATALLRAGVDPVTVARLGGWRSAQHVFSTYGHALDDPTLTDRILDTPGAQSPPQTRKGQYNE